MTRVKIDTTDSSKRTRRAHPATSASARVPRDSAPFGDSPLDEVESVAQIGSYSTDLVAGRWVSSNGLDAIFGIGALFERSVDGWVSLVHPADRDMMVAYLTDEVLGQGRPFDKQYRILRADTGEERWVHGRGALEFDRSGRPVRMLGTIADITDQKRTQEAVVASELRYAAIFEGAQEAILITELESKRFRWVNPAAAALLGYARDELLEMTVDQIHPAEEMPAVRKHFEAILAGQGTTTRVIRCLHRDGTVLLANIDGSSFVIDGVRYVVGFFTDVTELRRLEIQDRKLAQAMDQTADAILITSPAGEIEYVNPALRELTGHLSDESIGGNAMAFRSLLSAAATEDARRAISTGESWSGDAIISRPDGTQRVAEASMAPVFNADGTMTGLVNILRDVTDERALSGERQRLVAAVEQTSDSVIITDLAGTIEYVNPAFELASGYRSDEVIGQNPRILKSGQQSTAFYRAMFRRLTRGQTWAGTLLNRHRDGSPYEEEATISPIRDGNRAITGYVAVKRDVTALRAAESRLSTEFRERAAVAAALAQLQPAGSAAETAAAICEGLLSLPGIDVATIVTFPQPGVAVPLAVVGRTDLPIVAGQPVPDARAKYLYERAQQGPWAEAWKPRPQDGPFGEAMAASGIRAIAYAPIRNGYGLLGFVSVMTCEVEYAQHLIDHLPAVGEFAATASALLSGPLERGLRDDVLRKRVQRALAAGGLSPVFQPIVTLDSGTVIGHEALTRFADGTPPNRLIAEAHSVGLGHELEVACVVAALEAADALPRDAWLSLNVSPSVILDSSELPLILAGKARRIVLEVTEHVEIDAYAALREAVSRLGPTVSLAVDDAGAGFASLRHIVELSPRYLKVDISLVREVDTDLVRQAMIAGLQHFAARAGCEVIAEGIETPAELEALRELGIRFGQGYLLGRPAPVSRGTDGS